MSRYQSPYSQDVTLTDLQERAEPVLPGPAGAAMHQQPLVQYRVHPAARYFRRGPWENVAVGLIGLGILMLMQPFALSLFTWSFVTILAGTAMFVIVSHVPE
jgi:hypothetical protein